MQLEKGSASVPLVLAGILPASTVGVLFTPLAYALAGRLLPRSAIDFRPFPSTLPITDMRGRQPAETGFNQPGTP